MAAAKKTQLDLLSDRVDEQSKQITAMSERMDAQSARMDELSKQNQMLCKSKLLDKCLCGEIATRTITMKHPAHGRWEQKCCESCTPWDIWRDSKSTMVGVSNGCS